MKYLELIKETNEEVLERYELVRERVIEIAKDASSTKNASEYFVKTAEHLLKLYAVADLAQDGKLVTMSAEDGQKLNASLFEDIRGERYAISYANPVYAVEKLGLEAGQILSAIYVQIRSTVKPAFEGIRRQSVRTLHLFRIVCGNLQLL